MPGRDERERAVHCAKREGRDGCTGLGPFVMRVYVCVVFFLCSVLTSFILMAVNTSAFFFFICHYIIYIYCSYARAATLFLFNY